MKLRAVLFFAASALLFGRVAGQPGPDRTVMLGIGRSMLPTLPAECRIVVVRIPFGEVRVGVEDGDIIATRLNGLDVVHRAIGRLSDGSLVTRGDNNPRHDPLVTTERNYVGVVTGFEKPGTIGELLVPASRPESRALSQAEAVVGAPLASPDGA